MMTRMDNKPLQEFPRENQGTQGEQAKGQPNQITKWMEALAHLGLGESALRIGTNILTILLVVVVVWLMQTLYQQANLGWTPNALAASEASPAYVPCNFSGTSG